MLNRFAQHAIACVLCELLCLELFNVFFQHENRFRYKFFDIVQFSRSCSASALRLKACLFYHRSDFLSSSFFEVFRFLSNLERSQFLGAGRNFRTSIGSFRFTSSWDSEVILLSQRLALKYNTIRRARCQHFFASFFRFFFFFLRQLKSASSSWILRVRHPDTVDKNKTPTDVSCSSVGVRETSSHELFRRLKKGITILKNKVKAIP